MSKIFFTSDLHFSHKNIAKFCPQFRRFASVEAALEHMLPGRGQRQLQYFAHGLWLAVSAVDELEDAAERPFGIGAGEELHTVARLDVAAL